MEPLERVRYTFYNLLRNLLIVVGHNFLEEGGFKPNLFSFFLYGLNVLGTVSCIYTVLYYDVETGLKSIGYGAVNIQVTYKKWFLKLFLDLEIILKQFDFVLVDSKNFVDLSIWGHFD